jgi:Nif-specific regulatory protein/two-component system response regulator HydG
VGYEGAARTPEKRRFSRSLVRQAIETGAILESPHLLEDPRFAHADSVAVLGPCAVLVGPLRREGQVFGVLYLERRGEGGFSEPAQRLAGEFAEMAGLCLRNAVEREAWRQRNAALERDLESKHDFRGIVTADPKMLELLRLVAVEGLEPLTVSKLLGLEPATLRKRLARARQRLLLELERAEPREAAAKEVSS